MAQISMTLQYESKISTQIAAFEAGLGSCRSQAFDRQTVLPAPAPPTQHVSSSAANLVKAESNINASDHRHCSEHTDPFI